ncbi:MAG: cyclodeaminase/cyclohydrolase family protein [Deltaproteobacteria bacterium]|nr:cyclodeaminase/cyclohydrolase family protein [Deltaproteobacteria bacterium]
MKLEDVMAKIYDSNDFTAGGGSASAVSAAMAASLVGMVARLSVGKGLELSDEVYESLAAGMDEVSLALRDGAVRDLEAFLGIKSAYALPKGTEEEKAERREAIEKAAFGAADVPGKNALLARKVESAASKLAGRSNANAASDLEVGSDFANSAIKGCLANIRANLPLIHDPIKVEEFKSFVREMEEDMKAGKGTKE